MNKKILSLVAAMSLSACVQAGDGLEKVAPYPKAQENQVRHVIELENKENEGNYQVELIVGKEIMVDCNRQWFGTALEQKNLEGWGYDYYVVGELNGPMSTMMGCIDNTKKSAFVQANLGQEAFIRYNSKLPIVVYAPKDVEVKYRIWSADEAVKPAVKK